MFSTRGSSKNAKLGLVEKLLFEKNDILGQNLGQNRGKKSLPKNKLFAAISRKLEIFFLLEVKCLIGPRKIFWRITRNYNGTYFLVQIEKTSEKTLLRPG